MSKVITFSKTFPQHHARCGDKTFFVEKLLSHLRVDYASPKYLYLLHELNDVNLSNGKLQSDELVTFYKSLTLNHYLPISTTKQTTIRAGERFKKHDTASPRVWLHKPYHQCQIIIYNDLPVITLGIEMKGDDIYLNDSYHCKKKEAVKIASNDGLSLTDFISWFNEDTFKGQVINFLSNE